MIIQLTINSIQINLRASRNFKCYFLQESFSRFQNFPSKVSCEITNDLQFQST